MARAGDWAAEAERHHWGKRHPAHRVAAVRGCVAPGARVLEVGCGPGASVSLELLDKGYRAVASDFNADFVSRSREAAGARHLPLVVADGGALPFRDGAFDAVCAFDIAEHVDDDARAAAEWARVAARCVVVSVPSSEDARMAEVGLTFAHWMDRTHRRAYARQEVERLLAGAGLVDLDVRAEFLLHPADAYIHALAHTAPPQGAVRRARRAAASAAARVLRHAVDPHTHVPQGWLAVGWKRGAKD